MHRWRRIGLRCQQIARFPPKGCGGATMALRHTYSLLTAVLMTGGCLLRPSDSLPQQPITVGQLLPDFTLAALQGGEITLSSLRGKTVVLVFPRGRSGSGWCHVCHYQYAELAEFDEQREPRRNRTFPRSSSWTATGWSSSSTTARTSSTGPVRSIYCASSRILYATTEFGIERPRPWLPPAGPGTAVPPIGKDRR
jgi:hypothetical protein